jgi:hypothetical protein
VENDVSRDDFGKDLAMENLRSYAWHCTWNVVAAENPEWDFEDERISDEAQRRVDAGDYSGCGGSLEDEDVEWRVNYKHTPRARVLTIVEALSAIGSWQYHSCEHQHAKETVMWANMEMIEGDLIGALPGYLEFKNPTEEDSPPLAA